MKPYTYVFLLCASATNLGCPSDDDSDLPAGAGGKGQSGVDAGSAGTSGAGGEAAGTSLGGAPSIEDAVAACVRSCSVYTEMEKTVLSLPDGICEPGDLMQYGKLLGEAGAPADRDVPTEPTCAEHCDERTLDRFECPAAAVAYYDCDSELVWYCAVDGAFTANGCPEQSGACDEWEAAQ